MSDPARVSQLLLESATTLAQSSNARAIVVYADALPDLKAVPPRTILVARDEHDLRMTDKFAESHPTTITVPNVGRLVPVKVMLEKTVPSKACSWSVPLTHT